MVILEVKLREAMLSENEDRTVIHLADGQTVRLGALPDGMQNGKPSVMFGFEIDNETIVVAEMSLALLLTGVDAIKAVYGDPR